MEGNVPSSRGAKSHKRESVQQIVLNVLEVSILNHVCDVLALENPIDAHAHRRKPDYHIEPAVGDGHATGIEFANSIQNTMGHAPRTSKRS